MTTITATTVQDMPNIELGKPIPDAPHAVSVSLPSWKDNVGYEEGEEWVLSKMRNGYPRFFIQLVIQDFAAAIVRKYGSADEQALLFPSSAVAKRCVDFLYRYSVRQTEATSLPGNSTRFRVIDLVLSGNGDAAQGLKPMISAVIYPRSESQVARAFWQHSGDGVSSRRAEFCLKAFDQGYLTARTSCDEAVKSSDRTCKGPRRYQRKGTLSKEPTMAKGVSVRTLWSETADHTVEQDLDGKDLDQFVEERFGRNLNMSLATKAKTAIRRRIAGCLTADAELDDALKVGQNTESTRKVKGVSEDDVYLFPAGMNAIFNAHRTLLEARGPLKSVSFGFPYIDTLKILEKWGPGCLFYGNGSSADLDDLENRCKSGERFLALFCEFPGNPLLKSPDLRRIRRLADQYDFALVVDETIGNFLNVHVLPVADVMVSSLTKIFSGDSNVMGGSAVLNPQSRYYELLRRTLEDGYEDNYWPEDAIYLERNSRDFISRNERINTNAEAICDVLKGSTHIKDIHYPKFNTCRPFYEEFRQASGGYGGLLSVTFHCTEDAITFFDALDFAKGPSLGTNFTLCSPYVLLAHYNELDWAAKFGVEADLVRISVGLESKDDLIAKCRRALEAISARKS